MPVFTIVMAAYNASKTIERAINSILNQTFKNFELIICDDCSSDETNKIVKRFQATDDRIKLITKEQNGGSASARNECIKLAKGRYLTFLDSDDEWMPTYLESQLRFIEKNGPLVVCDTEIISQKGTKIFRPRDIIDYKGLIKGNDLYVHSSVIDLTVFKAPLFDSYFRKNEDYVYWLDFLKQGYTVKANHEVLVKYYIDVNSKNGNKRKILSFFKPLYNVYRKSEHFNPIKCVILIVKYYFYGKKKYKGII